jgi:hypothetical protein
MGEARLLKVEDSQWWIFSLWFGGLMCWCDGIFEWCHDSEDKTGSEGNKKGEMEKEERRAWTKL